MVSRIDRKLLEKMSHVNKGARVCIKDTCCDESVHGLEGAVTAIPAYNRVTVRLTTGKRRTFNLDEVELKKDLHFVEIMMKHSGTTVRIDFECVGDPKQYIMQKLKQLPYTEIGGVVVNTYDISIVHINEHMEDV